MPPPVFDPTISAGERPQTYALNLDWHFMVIKKHKKKTQVLKQADKIA
jgi:hypothetical protein